METVKKQTVREIINELEVGKMMRLDGVSVGAVQVACSALRTDGRDFMTKRMDGGIIVARVK